MYWPLSSLSQILHLLMVDNLKETSASFELLVFNQGGGRHLWPRCLFPMPVGRQIFFTWLACIGALCLPGFRLMEPEIHLIFIDN